MRLGVWILTIDAISLTGNVEMYYDFWIFLAKNLNREVLWRGEFRCQTGTRLYLLTQMVLILQREELGLFGRK